MGREPAVARGAVHALQYISDGNGNWSEATAAGGAVSIADGSNVVEGTTTDAAVTGDNPGTISAKLRGLNARTPALGQATMANSAPVVIASNQSLLLVIAL